jgi:phosphoribosylformylglycinamidine synthase PurS subunit
MPAIKPTCLRDLKLRVNIVDVVGRVATLRKAGSRFKGLCPFHNEKSPSFHVDPDKGFYKCFGCGKAGDIITFVRETEQLNFTEAIEALGLLVDDRRPLAGLGGLGFAGLGDVRVGRYVEIELAALSKAAAEKTAKDMCEKLLANTVIENYRIEIAE